MTSSALSTNRPPLKLCVVIHAYYTDILPQLLLPLRNISLPYTLCIGVANIVSKSVAERLIKDTGFKGTLHCSILPNRGRNFSTFLFFSAIIKQHDLVLHLHTKKSKHARTGFGELWLNSIVSGLVGTKQLVNDVLKNYETNPRLGLVYPSTFEGMPYWAHHWLKNFNLGSALLKRLGIGSAQHRGYFAYPVGGMFWCRVKALEGLFDLGLTHSDFEEEKGQTDGTLAHAIERCLTFLCTHSGFDYFEHDLKLNTFRGNWSELNLYQYRRNSPSRFSSIAKTAKVISFDIFDTMLVRPSLEPDSVMKFSEYRIDRALGSESSFFKLRKEAETYARRRKEWKGDVDINEIYREMSVQSGLDDRTISTFEHIEKVTDLSILSARPGAADLVFLARNLNKRVIAVSDTYYTKQDLFPALEKAGLYHLIDQIYLSSDWNARKDNGELWSNVFKHENCMPSELLHVGDNEHSDIQAVVERGGRYFHFINPTTAFEIDFPRWSMTQGAHNGSWVANLVLGPSAMRFEGSPFRQKNPLGTPALDSTESVGYAVFGPLIWSFFSWLAKLPSMKQVNTLYFLSREGYFLQRVYGLLKDRCPDLFIPNSKYLLASRKVALAASMAIDFVPNSITEGFPVSCTVGDLLNGRLGIQLEDQSLNRKVINLPQDESLLNGILEQNSQSLREKLVSKCQIYREYLDSMGLEGDGQHGIVDIGYSGTIQYHLQRITGKGLIGFYFATTPRIRRVCGEGEAHACFDEFSEMSQSRKPVMKHSIILEAFLSSPSPSFAGFTSGEEKTPCFEWENRTPEDLAVLEQLHSGAEKYVMDLLNTYGPQLFLCLSCSEETQFMLNEFSQGKILLPSKLESFFRIDDRWYGRAETISPLSQGMKKAFL